MRKSSEQPSGQAVDFRRVSVIGDDEFGFKMRIRWFADLVETMLGMSVMIKVLMTCDLESFEE